MIEADSVHSTPPLNSSADQTSQTRRAVLAGVASALTVGTAVAGTVTANIAAHLDDPIFAAIQRHKEANAVHLTAIEEADRLDEMGDGGFIWITEKPCHDENEAFDTMMVMAAVTLPGLLAKIDYLREIAEREAWMLTDREGAASALIESFATSIATLLAVRP
jgi:hypothetical protein